MLWWGRSNRNFLKNWWPQKFWGTPRDELSGDVGDQGVTEHFLRKTGCWKHGGLGHVRYKEDRARLCPWASDHVTALELPSFWIPGGSPKKHSPWATLQSQELPLKTRSLHHHNCLEDNRTPHLAASEVTCMGAIFGIGEGESDCSGHPAQKPVTCLRCHRQATAQLTSLILFIILTLLTQVQLVSPRISKAFVYRFHGQPLVSPLSLLKRSAQLLTQMGWRCWFLLWVWTCYFISKHYNN